MAENNRSARIVQAAYNNAIWCDLVCCAHDIPGTFEPEIWLNPNRVPPFYPNAVTLSGKGGTAQQMITLQHLVAQGPQSGLAVKDSFNDLELTPLGFQVLFEAQWLWRSAALPKPTVMLAEIRWTTVRQPEELTHWETAWATLPANQQQTPDSRIFPPSLLANPDVVFIAAYRNEQIVAGAIGNRTGDVVGLSNQFGPEQEAASWWAGCVSLCMDAYPGRAIVGYEQGAELALAQTLDFEALGSLRVWIQNG